MPPVYSGEALSVGDWTRQHPEVPCSLNQSTTLRLPIKIFIPIFDAAFRLLKLLNYYSKTERDTYNILTLCGNSKVSKTTCAASYLILNNHHLKSSKFCCKSELCFNYC